MHLKKLLIITILLAYQFGLSQTFVDDVERVAIVVIDYCVDENGERYDIKLNQVKTTYKHAGWQEGCLQHFNDGTLIDPMKMVNNCWQAVYYFVNSKYKTYELPEEDKEKCREFHRGEYQYESPAYQTTRILRRKNKQIEKIPDKDQRQVYGIKWLEDHIYELETLKMPLEKDKDKIGKIITVEIIEILNEKTYLYKAYIKNDNGDSDNFGLITKVSE